MKRKVAICIGTGVARDGFLRVYSLGDDAFLFATTSQYGEKQSVAHGENVAYGALSILVAAGMQLESRAPEGFWYN